MVEIRIATFNLENFDETEPGEAPSLDRRLELMRPQINRLRADIVCLQEVNGQERDGEPRQLLALQQLLAGSNLEGATIVSTAPASNAVYDQRNLVVASNYPVVSSRQIRFEAVDEHSARQDRQLHVALGERLGGRVLPVVDEADVPSVGGALAG